MGVKACGLACGRVRVVLLLAAVFANYLVQPIHAYYFDTYVTWANHAVQGGPVNASCQTSATNWLDFVYALVQQKATTVGTGQLTQACTECSAAIDAALTLLPSSQPSVCPLLPSPYNANLTALSLRRFVCLGIVGGSGAGSCVVQAVSALTQVDGLLERVRLQDPTLTFTSPLLQSLCPLLFPPPPAPPSCCPATWAYLMAALAQQSCLRNLTHEYLSLPGRCSALQNMTMPGFCYPSWPSDLLPLLSPPPFCASPPGSQAPLVANSSACSQAQLGMVGNASSSCDLWCGVVGTMNLIDAGVIPSPDTPDDSGDNSTTNSTGGGGGGGNDLQTVTIVIVCIFSVLIALLLVFLVLFGWKVHREKRILARQKYDFDADYIFPPHFAPGEGPATPPPAAPQNPPSLATTSAAAKAGPAAGAAAVAAAGGEVSTPRYQPGSATRGVAGPEAATLTFALAPPAGEPARSVSRQMSTPLVGLVAAAPFLDPAGSSANLGLLTSVGGIGRSSLTSRASSSKFESAMSNFPKGMLVHQGSSGLGASVTGGTPPLGVPTTGLSSYVTAATPSGSVTSQAGPSGLVPPVGLMSLGAGPVAVAAVPDRLRSHPVSLSGSDATTVYHTVHSPITEALVLTGDAPSTRGADLLPTVGSSDPAAGPLLGTQLAQQPAPSPVQSAPQSDSPGAAARR